MNDYPLKFINRLKSICVVDAHPSYYWHPAQQDPTSSHSHCEEDKSTPNINFYISSFTLQTDDFVLFPLHVKSIFVY